MITLLSRLSRWGEDSLILGAIRESDCNLAIWHRPAFADFTAMTTGTPLDLRFVSDIAGFAAVFAKELRSGGFGGDAALHDALIVDAARLARLFCDAMELTTIELRLEVVRTDSCRKFHADYVTARLITTYVGEGTDWLDDADARRVAAGAEPRQINRLAPFDVGLFKGKIATPTPAIHRSPPIAETSGGARLLLVLNPVSRPLVEPEDSALPPPRHLP